MIMTTPSAIKTTADQRLAPLGCPEPTAEAWAEAARLVMHYQLYECVTKLDRASTSQMQNYFAQTLLAAAPEACVAIAIALAARADMSELELVERAMGHAVPQRIHVRACLVGEGKMVGCSPADAVAVVAVCEFVWPLIVLNEANPQPSSESDVRVLRAPADYLAQLRTLDPPRTSRAQHGNLC